MTHAKEILTRTNETLDTLQDMTRECSLKKCSPKKLVLSCPATKASKREDKDDSPVHENETNSSKKRRGNKKTKKGKSKGKDRTKGTSTVDKCKGMPQKERQLCRKEHKRPKNEGRK
ncbi:hypothetical protein DPMN_066872 [Dreissena polymorpha]|uniref:Uncharacterized protein n=1 Tax=Dreissena polymorpha TaxID=45954 RepID=A0A9D3YYN1_DREPO|nr:hypothetical protein DPMN_066872 [Dreissena polymorpha]